MPQAKTEVALQFSECCAAETALQHWLFCSAVVICTKSCAAANERLHCNIEIAALQESGAFLPLSCGFQAPTFWHPRFGLAEKNHEANVRANNSGHFEGTAHENVGFRGKKGQKVHPNFAPNITMEFHYHAFCAPDSRPIPDYQRGHVGRKRVWCALKLHGTFASHDTMPLT